MKKRIILFVAVATLTLAMTACGSENVNVETEMNGRFEVIKDIEVTTPTAEPTKAVETTTAPTATSAPTVEPTTEPTVEPTATSTPTPEPTATSTPTPTPEPTSTPTPEPTATPVPTSTPTPEPTSTPVPTEAPVVETDNWETVLQKLHSLETYEEREAYIETLDKSKYEVAAVDNFDLIAVPNRTEVVEKDGIEEFVTTKYTLLDPHDLDSVEYYIENILNCDDYIGGTTGEYYLMTIIDLTTGQVDPWGVRIHTTVMDMETWEDVETVAVLTLETLVNNTNKVTDELNEARGDKYAYIKTWETKFYYE